MRGISTLFTWTATVLAAASVVAAPPVVHKLGFDGPGWELVGDGAVVEEFDGRQALRLLSGAAIFRDLELLDGTIEFELQVTEYRSFAYVYFRMEDDQEHEEVYFRPHKSLLPDAIQYTPVYRGSSQWQLYHDAGSTAAAALPANQWIPIKLVLSGERAAVFVGGAEMPQLVVPRMARPPKGGYIALRSFMTFGTPPDTYVANFANVVVRPDVVDYDFPEEAEESPVAGRVEAWQVSTAFEPAEGPILELPADQLSADGWKTVPSRSDGLVELERYLTRPDGVRRAAVLARLQVTAEEAGPRRIDLGFSDEISVFLNGRLLVVDDESYSFNLPRRQGLWSSDQLSVYLPLEEGSNQLVVAITDRFGGWALSGRFESSAGLAAGLPE